MRFPKPFARQKPGTEIEANAPRQITLDQWADFFSFGDTPYVIQQTLAGVPQAEILPIFSGLSELAFKRNGIVFAAVALRMRLYSEARFKFRPKRTIGTGQLFGGQALSLFEQPWSRGSTRDLLSRISMDEDLAGNAYVWKESSSTLRMGRPDWMTIVLGSARLDGKVGDIDTEIIGYIYKPPGNDEKVLLPEQVAHFMSIPDPIFPFRGMSWLQPVIEEIRADNATTTHKLKFFENGATANMVVTLNSITDPEEFDKWIDRFEKEHKGFRNAYKTLYLAGGADAKVVGTNFEELQLTATQAHGETRIAIAAGVPPIVLGISEGLDKSTYSNYGQARRQFADETMRPRWGYACERLGRLISLPPGAELWYEDRGIPWLAEDQKDLAATQQMQAAAISTLVLAGYHPDAVVEAILAGDLSKLEHTGLFSVQLQPPGTGNPPPPAPATSSRADLDQTVRALLGASENGQAGLFLLPEHT